MLVEDFVNIFYKYSALYCSSVKKQLVANLAMFSNFTVQSDIIVVTVVLLDEQRVWLRPEAPIVQSSEPSTFCGNQWLLFLMRS